MILKDLIFEVCDEIGCFDEEFKQKLLRTKLKNIEDQILGITNVVRKTYKTVVDSSLRVRLPYDFKYPLSIKVNNAIIYRAEKQEVKDSGGTYSVDISKISLSDKRNLKLRSTDFEMINIVNKRSINEYGFGYNVYGNYITDNIPPIIEEISFGYIFDNSGEYVPENIDNIEVMPVHLRIRDAGDDVNRYEDVKRTVDGDVVEILTTFGLYKVKINNTPDLYYIAENGYTYDAEDLTTANLLTRGTLSSNNQVINFNNIKENDVVEIEYLPSGSIYINENQISIVADSFKNALYSGAVQEGWRYLKKERRAREWQGYFSDELKIIEREAGKMTNFGKQKFFRSAGAKYRLPFMR